MRTYTFMHFQSVRLFSGCSVNRIAFYCECEVQYSSAIYRFSSDDSVFGWRYHIYNIILRCLVTNNNDAMPEMQYSLSLFLSLLKTPFFHIGYANSGRSNRYIPKHIACNSYQEISTTHFLKCMHITFSITMADNIFYF